MGDPAQHGEASPDGVAARRQALVGQRLPAGEDRNLFGREQPAEGGLEVFRFAGRRGDDEERAGVPRGACDGGDEERSGAVARRDVDEPAAPGLGEDATDVGGLRPGLEDGGETHMGEPLLGNAEMPHAGRRGGPPD